MEGKQDIDKGRKFLMWFGGVVKKYNLSQKDALLLFLAERNGRECVLSDKCITYALGIKKRNIPDYLRRLKNAGVIDGSKGFSRNKRRLYNVCISRQAYDDMQHDYRNGKNCFRVDAVFQPTAFKMQLSEVLVVCCIKCLQRLRGFEISRASIMAYTGLSRFLVTAAVENPKIAKFLVVKKKKIGQPSPVFLYRFKKWKEEALFTTPYKLADKLFTISQELVKSRLATNKIRDFVLYRINDMHDGRSLSKAMEIGVTIVNDAYLCNAVYKLFGHSIHELTKKNTLLYGRKAIVK